MCGFLGEFGFNGTLTSSTEFQDLLDLSKHRGPDNSQVITHPRFQLGFNRLAILDLSVNGNQPKPSPSGRYHLVFNGEIYNFQALRDQYELTNLKSTSDTEVLVHLLDELGVDKTVKALNGMFAIGIIDSHDDVLYLTRDFAGIKPLFYGITDEGIVLPLNLTRYLSIPCLGRIYCCGPR